MIIGVDPGFTGAIAFDFKTLGLKVYDLPLTMYNKRKQVDPAALNTLIRNNYSTVSAIVVLEDVHAMPKQGLVSTFRFGYNAGILLGVLSTHDLTIVRVKPAVWKSALGLTSNKKDSLTLARKLFPEQADLFKRAKDDGRAEAALLAHFGRKYLS